MLLAFQYLSCKTSLVSYRRVAASTHRMGLDLRMTLNARLGCVQGQCFWKISLYFANIKICNLCTPPFDMAPLMRIPMPNCVQGVLSQKHISWAATSYLSQLAGGSLFSCFALLVFLTGYSLGTQEKQQKIAKTRKTKQNQAKTHKQQTRKNRQEKLAKTHQKHPSTETSRVYITTKLPETLRNGLLSL